MSRLTWDEVGERRFETGVDRGVLYLAGGGSVVWNGLTGVDETFNREAKAYYQDGQKYLTQHVLGEFEGKLKAFTYPDVFDVMDGVYTKNAGLFVHDQMPQSFGLSYRTKIGDDQLGLDRGYRIHLLYNLQASPDDRAYLSVGDQVVPMEFSWTLTTVPALKGWGYRPTSHLSLKSTDLDANTLAYLEGVLYGTDTTPPQLPSFAELVDLLENPPAITIASDGESMTATGSDSDVMMIDANTYDISNADATDQGLGEWEFNY